MPDKKVLTPEERQQLSNAITEKIKAALAQKRTPETDSEITPLIQKEMAQIEANLEKRYQERLAKEAEEKAEAQKKELEAARQKRSNGSFSLEKAMRFELPNYGDSNNKGGFLPDPMSYKGLITMTTKELEQWKLPDQREQVKWAQQMNDRLYILGMILSKTTGMPYAYCVLNSKTFRDYASRLEDDAELRKAINITTTGEGLELVPTGMSGRILERIQMEVRLAAAFEEIPMPTNPYEIPVQTGESQTFIITETTVNNPTLAANAVEAWTPPTGDFLLRAKGLGSRVRISYRATEDAIIAVVPYAETKIVEGQARGLEDALLNGDDSATHQDSDTHAGSAKLPAKLWKGIRYYGRNAAAGTVDFANGDPTKALLASILLKSGEYSSMVRDLLWIPGSKGYVKLRMADIGVFTVDQYGDQAVVLNGELAQWGGIPIIPSPKQRENLNASGVYDGVTTDRGVLSLVQRRGFLIGTVGTVLLETDRDIESQQVVLVGSRWLHFKSPWDPTLAAYPFVSLGINLKTVA
ncbi:MAG: phage major capsid protein [candidate division KSB1 bacterium]|nr:phage major capsid protein [candidate division KSB1 bacterium]